MKKTTTEIPNIESNLVTESIQTEVAGINSAEFSITAKGDVTFSVKAYAESPAEAERIAGAMALEACNTKKLIEENMSQPKGLPAQRPHDEVVANRARPYFRELLKEGRSAKDARLLADFTARQDMDWEERQQR